MKGTLRWFAALALALAAPAAGAQSVPDATTTRIQIERFEPQHSHGVNLLNVVRPEVLGHGTLSVGAFLNHSNNPLVLPLRPDGGGVDADGDGYESVIRHQNLAEFFFAVGLWDVIDVGLVMPIILARSGDELARFDRPGEVLGSFALGDLRVTSKVRLLDGTANSAGVGVGLGATIYVPTGDDENFASYGDFRARPFLAVDWSNGRNGLNVALNVAYELQPRRVLNNVVLDDSLHWSLGIDVPMPVTVLRLFGVAYGTFELEQETPVDPSVEDLAPLSDDMLELLVGFTVRLDDVVFTMAAGAGVTGAPGSPDFRMVIGAGWVPRFGVGDNDEDGVPNIQDQCGTVAEDLDGFEDADGCPDEDNDGDGVIDALDGEQDDRGLGQCRDLPEDIDGFEDADGCPDPDNDGDGIPDVDDPCPNAAEDVDGFEDADGCPDDDNDGDGVPDIEDGALDESGSGRCRNKAETVNGYLDRDGCPDKAPTHLKLLPDRLELLTPVEFEAREATPLRRSRAVLDEIARVLLEDATIEHLNVEAHTHWRGTEASNDLLSERRAAAVVKYLVDAGVAPERLGGKGWGEQRPLVTGDDGRKPEGMARNERVELLVKRAVEQQMSTEPEPAEPTEPSEPAEPPEAPDQPDAPDPDAPEAPQ